jgi:FlaA1/EpsC-like NDP-sugar epimerase
LISTPLSKTSKRGSRGPFVARVAALVLVDALTLNLGVIFALWLRMRLEGGANSLTLYLPVVIHDGVVFTVFVVLVNYALGLYTSLWHYAGATEVAKLALSSLLVFSARFLWDTFQHTRLPLSVYPVSAILFIFSMASVRLGYRFFRRLRIESRSRGPDAGPRTLIVGAGESGSLLLHSLASNPRVRGHVVALIDDDPGKHGLRLHGACVRGNRYRIPDVVKRYRVERIMVAVPGATSDALREILEICLTTGCEVQKVVPEDLLDIQSVKGLFSLETNLRVAAIQPEDLLGRTPVDVDPKTAEAYLKDRTVLVTGGAGSIGSEIVRQTACFSPKRILIFDVNENDSHALDLEMKRRYPQVPFTVVMGSVRDEEKLAATFARYHPDVVFHAAAHKHVPLRENDPEEAVKNNVLGTYQTALAAASHGVERFILVSTDKAVNPTNVMGASKRMCEFVIKGLADTSDRIRSLAPESNPTRYAAVRFGNVLGSNGSVIPLFKRQIEQGGPVTITHPEMTRYFMTIPEAARLVIEAGAMANGGEIFVLDMGKPVKIADLAKDMIRLAGLKAETDIRIEYVGLRPGEKLYEELVMSNENTEPTYHARISRLQDVGVLREALERDLRFLSDALVGGLDMRTALRQVVPTFSPDLPAGEESQG